MKEKYYNILIDHYSRRIYKSLIAGDLKKVKKLLKKKLDIAPKLREIVHKRIK